MARGGTDGRGVAGGGGGGGKEIEAPEDGEGKPRGLGGKVGDVGVVGDSMADLVFFSFTAGGTFS